MRKKYPLRVKILAAIIMTAIILTPIAGVAGIGYWIYTVGVNDGHQQAVQQKINLKGGEEVVINAAEYIRWQNHQRWLREHPEAIGSIHD